MFVIHNNNNMCNAYIIWPYQIIWALDIKTGERQTMAPISINYCM